MIKFCVKHPLSVLMSLLLLILCEIVALTNISFDYIPKLNERYLLVNACFEGVRADEMRKLVTVNLEDSLVSLKGLKNISSVTRDGLTLVVIELGWSTDSSVAFTQCAQIIDECYEILPKGCSKPEVQFFTPDSDCVLTVTMRAFDNDMEYCRYIGDNEIKGTFARIDGVSWVSISGGEKSEVHVIADKAKLESMGLTLESISEILYGSNVDYPAGIIYEGNKEILLKTNGLFDSVFEIQDCPLSYTEKGLVKIGDVAKIKNSLAEQKSCFIYNGKEVVGFKIFKKADSSPIEVSRKIKKQVARLNELYKSSFEFQIISDSSWELVSSLKNLLVSAFVGCFIIAIVLFLFLRSFRICFIACSILPLTVLFSVLVLSLCGKSLNLLSIAGLTVGIGMVIDPTVVALENVQKKLAAKNTKEAIVQGVKEIKLSSIGSTLTTVVVFVPFFFLGGIFGKLFSDMAVSIIASIGFSCVLALIYVPAILSLLHDEKKLVKKTGTSIAVFENFYKKSLGMFFASKIIIVLIFVLCLIVSFICIKTVKKEIFPVLKGNVINAKLFYGENTRLSVIKKDAFEITSLLLADENFIDASVICGIEDDDFISLSDESLRKEVMILKCKTKNQEAAKKSLQKICEKSELKISIENERSILEKLLKFDLKSSIVTENTLEKLEELISQNKKEILSYEPESYVHEYSFIPDRSALSRFNISALALSQTAKNCLEGVYSSPLYKNGRQIPVLVKYSEETISSAFDLENCAVVAGESFVLIGSLGKIEQTLNNKILFRYNRKDAKKVVFEKNACLKATSINPQEEEFSNLIKNAVFLLLIVVLLLYCVMGAQFESFLIPVFMLLALPPCFAGAFIALKISSLSLNINSIVALVVLFGTSVNNSIILFEEIRSLKDVNKMSVINGCSQKLRSILITTLTSIFALVPFAFDFSKKTDSSMSMAIIGGLFISLIVVLFVVPVILKKFMRRFKSE
ncbi:efflux RND transporter permease subunit [Treponema pectinovorum]|uniref:efflux RND transporter permease subunit n=1 Tax=Treponema pectinovorum TaxID=164 RepID=UPI003D8B1115